MGIDLKLKLELHAKWLRDESDGERLVLSYSDLRGSDLSNSDLSNSDLRGSDLSNSDLSGSNLSNSDLSNSDLSNSDLRGSDLSGSNLSYSNLSGSNLDFACWPLRCGSFNVKACKRLVAQLAKHLAMLDVSMSDDEELKAAMSEFRALPMASWFDEFRDDLAKTPKD